MQHHFADVSKMVNLPPNLVVKYYLTTAKIHSDINHHFREVTKILTLDNTPQVKSNLRKMQTAKIKRPVLPAPNAA